MTDLSYGKLLVADEYAKRHDTDPGFETAIMRARQNCNLRFLLAEPAGRVLEVGCGPDLLACRAIAAGVTFSDWTILEPAQVYASGAADFKKSEPRLEVMQGYLEERVSDLRSTAPNGFDTVIVSGVVHETTTPGALIEAAVKVTRHGGRVLVSAPNALSFHRLLAVKMGLIQAPDAVSERNRALGQPVVFDPVSLRALLLNAGLVDLELTGYLFKPFTNVQMIRIAAILGDEVMAALDELGRDFPQNAAEICITARRK